MKPLVKRQFTAEYPVRMNEVLTPTEFKTRVQSKVYQAMQDGFTEVFVELLSDGQYEDRYDYLAVVGYREETDEELAVREKARKVLSERLKAICASQLKAAQANGFKTIKAYNDSKHIFPCLNQTGKFKCTNMIDDRKTDCCNSCGMLQPRQPRQPKEKTT